LPLPPQTANPIPCIHPAGIARSSRHRIAIGRSPLVALPVEQRGAQGQVAVAGGGGEEGFALVEGHKEQIALAGFVPEHAFAVDPGGVARQDPERRFDFGPAVAAVDAHRDRPGPGPQLQQLVQVVAPGCGLPG
jgi:hypothetical protein